METILRAYSRLIALKNNLPKYSIHEKYVKEYHEIIDLLSREVKTQLDEFKIPLSEVKHEITSSWPSLSEISQEAGQTYSEDKYCERNFFLSKIDALLSYFSIKYSSKEDPKIGFNPPKYG